MVANLSTPPTPVCQIVTLNTPTFSPPDLAHLWALYETAALPTVANLFRSRLLELHHCTDDADTLEQGNAAADFRAAFIGCGCYSCSCMCLLCSQPCGVQQYHARSAYSTCA